MKKTTEPDPKDKESEEKRRADLRQSRDGKKHFQQRGTEKNG